MSNSSPPPIKRYRREEEKNEAKNSEDEDDYVPYVSVKERRKQKLVKLVRDYFVTFKSI